MNVVGERHTLSLGDMKERIVKARCSFQLRCFRVSVVVMKCRLKVSPRISCNRNKPATVSITTNRERTSLSKNKATAIFLKLDVSKTGSAVIINSISKAVQLKELEFTILTASYNKTYFLIMR